MNHGEVKDRLGPYLEGELPLQQRALVDAHLDACDPCAEELRELRATIDLLQRLPDEAPPEGLADRVLARVRAGEADPTLLGRALDAFDAMLRPGVLTPVLAGALGALAIVVLQARPLAGPAARQTGGAAPPPVAQLPPTLPRPSATPFIITFDQNGRMIVRAVPVWPTGPIGAGSDDEPPPEEFVGAPQLGAPSLALPQFVGRLETPARDGWAESVHDQALHYGLSNELDRSLRGSGERKAIDVDFSNGPVSEDR
jgi:hypothetical protein